MTIKTDHVLDAKDLACPMPIVKTRKAVNELLPGQVLEVQATDTGSTADIQAWAQSSGHHYIGTIENDGVLKHYIRRATSQEEQQEIKHPHVISNAYLQEKLNNHKDLILIDVREHAEYVFNHIPGAISIPFGELEHHIQQFNKDDEIHVICRTGNRSDLAAQKLTEKGFKHVINVIPGMSEWKNEEDNQMTFRGITAQEIAQKVLNKEAAFILDVRNEDAFHDWKIEGENFEYLNVPYFDLIDGIEAIQDQLPPDQQIIVVCAKEGSSQMIAEMIHEAGLNVAYLEGGMKSWSEHLEKVIIYEDEEIKVYQFIRIGKGCLSYMVVSDDEALIVDPSRFIDAYKSEAQKAGATITHVVDSHLHADHISGGKMLADDIGANYYLMKSEGAAFDFLPLEQYEKIEFNNVTLEVLAVKTPGHTPGSVSFFVNGKLLFSGDTIFVSGLGRPDLGNKVRQWANDLYETVYSKVSEIADDVIVLPGHYGNLDEEINTEGYIGDRLGHIRQRNEKMFNTTKEEFLDHVEKSASSVKPPNFEEIVAINRGLESVGIEQMQELEIGPNRCAVHHTD